MTKYTIEEIINGAIEDCLNDWVSSYKINEDLPYVAEMITGEIMKALKTFDLIIIEKHKSELSYLNEVMREQE